ncbi:MAG: hypothetical protein FWF79_05850 [Defluviitaleaceae bacterium]|nr:hypothetical protein [Defluviitaleaceae bacterium]
MATSENPIWAPARRFFRYALSARTCRISPLLTPRQSFVLQNSDTPLGKGVTPPSQTNNLIGGVICGVRASSPNEKIGGAATQSGFSEVAL